MTHEAPRACLAAAVIFGIVSCLHAARLIKQTEVIIGNWPVPMALSWSALLLSGVLAWWMWRSSQS
jgi:uncharacterized membrane protein AbrB (regulator of aidB expression)